MKTKQNKTKQFQKSYLALLGCTKERLFQLTFLYIW